MGLKTLLPSLKENKRYIIFEVIGKSTISKTDLTQIKKEIEAFLGVDQAANAGLQFIKSNQNKVMLRAHTKYIDKIKVSLLLINKLGNKNIIIKTSRVSGILKKVNI